jgi:hypothetical protein
MAMHACMDEHRSQQVYEMAVSLLERYFAAGSDVEEEPVPDQFNF